MELLFQNKVSSAVADKVKSISYKLGIDPSWLMLLMYKESGLDAQAQNPKNCVSNGNKFCCVGLIQFCPDNGQAYKTINGQKLYPSDFNKMDSLKQLDYVYEYFYPFHIKGKLKSYFDLYLVTFFPVAVGKSDDEGYIFQASGISAYDVAKQNPTMDLNKDGQVTMAEFKKWVSDGIKTSVPIDYYDIFFKKNSAGEYSTESAERNMFQSYQREIVITIIIIGLLIALWYVGKKLI